MILGGVALSERRADRREEVMAMFEGCDIFAIGGGTRQVVILLVVAALVAAGFCGMLPERCRSSAGRGCFGESSMLCRCKITYVRVFLVTTKQECNN